MLNTFSQKLEVSPAELEKLLSLSFNDFLISPQRYELLGGLDIQLIKQTLPMAKSILAERLPAFYDWLKNELGVENVPDSPNHATTWVINFLNNQESLSRLVELHDSVPRLALERSIPRLVAAFEGIENEQIRQAWQKAFAALCLVLVIAARDRERLVPVAV